MSLAKRYHAGKCGDVVRSFLLMKIEDSMVVLIVSVLGLRY